MPKIKSLIARYDIDKARRSHNCQANAKHRIKQGETRFKVKDQRNWQHYCLDCAKKIVSNDINTLGEISKKFNLIDVDRD